MRSSSAQLPHELYAYILCISCSNIIVKIIIYQWYCVIQSSMPSDIQQLFHPSSLSKHQPKGGSRNFFDWSSSHQLLASEGQFASVDCITDCLVMPAEVCVAVWWVQWWFLYQFTTSWPKIVETELFDWHSSVSSVSLNPLLQPASLLVRVSVDVRYWADLDYTRVISQVKITPLLYLSLGITVGYLQGSFILLSPATMRVHTLLIAPLQHLRALAHTCQCCHCSERWDQQSRVSTHRSGTQGRGAPYISASSSLWTIKRSKTTPHVISHIIFIESWIIVLFNWCIDIDIDIDMDIDIYITRWWVCTSDNEVGIVTA